MIHDKKIVFQKTVDSRNGKAPSNQDKQRR